MNKVPPQKSGQAETPAPQGSQRMKLNSMGEPLPSFSQELTDVPIYFRGLFVDHPVGAVGDALDGDVRHYRIEAVEVRGEERCVLLAPNHQGRRRDHVL